MTMILPIYFSLTDDNHNLFEALIIACDVSNMCKVHNYGPQQYVQGYIEIT